MWKQLQDVGAPVSAAFRIFHVAGQGSLTLERLTIKGGHASGAGLGQGGAILNRGPLTIVDTTLVDNAADGDGGVIFNYDRAVTIERSVIMGNTAVFCGGGISSLGGTLRIRDSVISEMLIRLVAAL